MVEFIKEFSINDVVRNSPHRRFTAYGTVEMYDRHGQLLPIDEFIKSMDDYMSNSRILLDNHTNKPVGKILSWHLAKKEGKEAIKITGEIYKNRAGDKVWEDIQAGKREGISVGGSSEKIEKSEEGEILTGIEINEFSIVDRCGNQGATFDTISIAKSEEVKKQTNDMEQTTQDKSTLQSNEAMKELEQRVDLLFEAVEEIKSLVSSKPNMEEDNTKKMEDKKQEDIQKEYTEEKPTETETKTESTDKSYKKEEEKSTDDVEKSESKEVEKEDDSFKKTFNEFAKSIQSQLDGLTNQIKEMKKFDIKKEEKVDIVKTEKPNQADTNTESSKYSDIMKSVESGETSKYDAIKQLMENQ